MLNPLTATIAFIFLIFIGSGFGANLDPALFNYLVVSIIGFFCVVWRLNAWIDRPPTRMYFSYLTDVIKGAVKKSRTLPESESGSSNKKKLDPAKSGEFIATRFIEQRSIRQRHLLRWTYHILLSGGSTLAFAITFPLVFGFLIFDGSNEGGAVYRLVAMGLPTLSFPVDSLIGWMFFNGLNISGVMVLTGVIMAASHRYFDMGLRSTTRFYEDWLPLIILFLVALTGVMLWVSAHYLHGAGHGILRTVHFITVAILILFIPFGKLFHMFQRWLSVLVKNHQIDGEKKGPEVCVSCGDPFHYASHAHDLQKVLNDIDMPYNFPDSNGTNSPSALSFMAVCPGCRRKRLAMKQGTLIGR